MTFLFNAIDSLRETMAGLPKQSRLLSGVPVTARQGDCSLVRRTGFKTRSHFGGAGNSS